MILNSMIPMLLLLPLKTSHYECYKGLNHWELTKHPVTLVPAVHSLNRFLDHALHYPYSQQQ